MDRDKVRLMREKIAAALEVFGKEFGVNVNVGRASYGDTHVEFRVEFAEVAADGMILDQAASNFKHLASIYGLPEDALGRDFQHQGNTYRVTGLNPRRRKMPVDVVRADGKGFKMPESLVARCLGVVKG